MYTREELFSSPEYWLEILQNELFRQVTEYLKSEQINQTQLAEKLGVSKGYISQIMNGNFNFTFKKLIELSLAIGKAPVLEFKPMDEFIINDNILRFNMKYSTLYNMDAPKSSKSVEVGNQINTIKLDQSLNKPSKMKVA